MKFPLRKLSILIVLILLLGLSLETVYAAKYYGKDYPKSYSSLSRDNFVNYNYYGNKYRAGNSYSGLNQNVIFVRDAYGSNYGRTTAFVGTTGRIVKSDYGSRYGQTTSFEGSNRVFVKQAYGDNYGDSTAFIGSNGQMVRLSYGSNYGENYATYDGSSDFYDPYYDPRDIRSGYAYVDYPPIHSSDSQRCYKGYTSQDSYRYVCY